MIHLLGIIHIHVHQPESMRCGCKIALHPPEEKEKNDIHASSQKKEREKKKGEVYGARHKTTLERYLHFSLALDPGDEHLDC